MTLPLQQGPGLNTDGILAFLQGPLFGIILAVIGILAIITIFKKGAVTYGVAVLGGVLIVGMMVFAPEQIGQISQNLAGWLAG